MSHVIDLSKSEIREHIDIYALVDPRTDEVRYIGQTKQGIETRLSQHIQDAKSGVMTNRVFRRWLLDLVHRGLRPDVYPVTTCTTEHEADVEERAAIKRFSGVYPGLFNLLENNARTQARPFTEPYLQRVGAA